MIIMIKTYYGYFQEDGCFITDGIMVKLPTKKLAIVNVLESEVVDNPYTAHSQSKLVAIKKIIADALDAEEAFTETDWDDMAYLRAKTNTGLSRSAII